MNDCCAKIKKKSEISKTCPCFNIFLLSLPRKYVSHKSQPYVLTVSSVASVVLSPLRYKKRSCGPSGKNAN
jgi:hypothetical protein